jgi:hypothetical protein
VIIFLPLFASVDMSASIDFNVSPDGRLESHRHQCRVLLLNAVGYYIFIVRFVATILYQSESGPLVLGLARQSTIVMPKKPKQSEREGF